MFLSMRYSFFILIVGTFPGCILFPGETSPDFSSVKVFEVKGVTVRTDANREILFYTSGMTIDADGAPNAYHPKDIGTDHVRNAGGPGNWWGIVTDTGNSDGEPVVQGAGDPFPGYYVSQTSLFDPQKRLIDPGRYVDANNVPYVVVPPKMLTIAELGDFAVVINRNNGNVSSAIVADVGARNRIGEGSIALAENLEVNANPRNGGVDSGIVTVIFPGSGQGFPSATIDIAQEGKKRFENWGGINRLSRTRPSLFAAP